MRCRTVQRLGGGPVIQSQRRRRRQGARPAARLAFGRGRRCGARGCGRAGADVLGTGGRGSLRRLMRGIVPRGCAGHRCPSSPAGVGAAGADLLPEGTIHRGATRPGGCDGGTPAGSEDRRDSEVAPVFYPDPPDGSGWGSGFAVWPMNTGVSCTAGVTGAVTPPVTPDPGPVTGCHGILRLTRTPPTGICCRDRPSPLCFGSRSRSPSGSRSRCSRCQVSIPAITDVSVARDRRFVPWDLARSFAVGQGRVVRGTG